jgi:hypothetical protein
VGLSWDRGVRGDANLSAMSDLGSAAADRFALSDKWLRRVYPWRGYDGPRARSSSKPLAPGVHAADVAEVAEQRLLDPDSDAELVSRVAGAGRR